MRRILLSVLFLVNLGWLSPATAASQVLRMHHDMPADSALHKGVMVFKQLVEARLGLNFEQFTRAVMLAQSEFSAFLKADDKERSELLEKLTNTAIYTRLGQRAFGLIDLLFGGQTLAIQLLDDLEPCLLGVRLAMGDVQAGLPATDADIEVRRLRRHRQTGGRRAGG